MKEAQDRYILVGTLHGSFQDCTNDWPTIYTRIDEFSILQFIRKVVFNEIITDSGTTTIQGSYDKCPTELEIGNAFAINGDCLAFGGRFERSKFEDAQAKCQSIFGEGFTGKIWKPRSETDIEFVRARAKSVWGSYKSAWVVDGSESSTNC